MLNQSTQSKLTKQPAHYTYIFQSLSAQEGLYPTKVLKALHQPNSSVSSSLLTFSLDIRCQSVLDDAVHPGGGGTCGTPTSTTSPLPISDTDPLDEDEDDTEPLFLLLKFLKTLKTPIYPQ